MIENLNLNYSQKMQRCHEYVEALEEERRKIQVFQRELPLCLELVTHAIEACRRELSGTSTEYAHGQSECSEQTTSDCGPAFEEFIPIKKCSSDEDDEHESRKAERENTNAAVSKNTGNSTDKKKSDWLRSVQLWNQSSDPPPKEDQVPKKPSAVEVKRNGGAFKPFHKEKPKIPTNEKETAVAPPVDAASSTAAEAVAGKKDLDKEGEKQQHTQQQAHRKQRRCWSPELHRRFLHALQQLGGSHVATPKQIRELMKVDGLTNDEVKSHLQKYRLHTRRPSSAVHGNGNAQAPQFVVVRGIWVPPPDYHPAVAATCASPEAPDRIYAPVAAPPVSDTSAPPQPPPPIQRPKRLRSDRCDSPASSTSTPPATASPAAS